MEVNESQGFRTPIYIEEKHELRDLMDFKRSSQEKGAIQTAHLERDHVLVSQSCMHPEMHPVMHQCYHKTICKTFKTGVSQ